MRRLILFLACGAWLRAGAAPIQMGTNDLSRDTVRQAQKIFGLNFSDSKIDLLLPGLEEELGHYQEQRRFVLSNSIPPAILFNPIPVGFKFETRQKKFKLSPLGRVKLPDNRDDLAYYSIEQLGALLKSRKITSEALTRLYLDRLKKYGPKL